jgi:hypothetical protein
LFAAGVGYRRAGKRCLVGEGNRQLEPEILARVVEVLGEGVIKGFVTGDFQSVFLDNTPIMNPNGTPNATCQATNKDFHVPKSSSGVSTLPGGGLMVSLGLWDNFIGTPFAQAATTMHELGHNLNLWHGGSANKYTDIQKQVQGKTVTRTQIAAEPNCKPNDLSIMSYLFQTHGLLDDLSVPHIDYSRAPNAVLHEDALKDGSIATSGSLPYRAAWFVPLVPGSLAFNLGLSPAKKFCSGANFPSPAPPATARFVALTKATPVDWNTGGVSSATLSQDINFDGSIETTLTAFDEWGSVRLNQVGGTSNMAGFSAGVDFGGGVDFSGGVDFGGGVEPFDASALGIIAGIALRRHHHGQGGFRKPAQIKILQLSVAGCQ